MGPGRNEGGEAVGIFKDRKPSDARVPPSEPRRRGRVKSPREIQSAIDEAMERGEFDNLPGRGQALSAEYLNPDPAFLAQKLLKDHGFVPEWAELGRQIDELDARIAALDAKGPDEARAALVAERNQLVRRYNLKVPFGWQQKGMMDPAGPKLPGPDAPGIG
jgi:hypothetical protein